MNISKLKNGFWAVGLMVSLLYNAHEASAQSCSSSSQSGSCPISVSGGAYVNNDITFSVGCSNFTVFSWGSNGGTVVASDERSITLRFSSTGTYCVSVNQLCDDTPDPNTGLPICSPIGNAKNAYRTITITNPPPPAAPSTCFDYTVDCGSTQVRYLNDPPEGYLYYWQTQPDGRSTVYGTSSTLTLTSSTTLYLQSKVGNTWGGYVQAGYNPNPSTWCNPTTPIVSVNSTPKPGAPSNPVNGYRFGSGNVTISATPGTNATSIRWTGGNPNAPEGASSTVFLNAGVTTTYTGRSLNPSQNCVSVGSVQATAAAYVIPTISATPPALGQGSPVTLSIGAGYDSYTWRNPAGQIIGTSGSSSVTVSTIGSYSVVVTKNGAISPTITYQVNLVCGSGTPNGCVIDGSSTFCVSGPNVSFSTSCSKASAFVWYLDGFEVGNGPVLNTPTPSVGSHCITLYAACDADAGANCPATGEWYTHKTFTVTDELPSPVISASATTMCQNSNITLSVTNPVGSQYAWFKQTGASNNFTYVGAGSTINYYVTEHTNFEVRYGTDLGTPLCGNATASVLVTNYKNEQTPVESLRLYRRSEVSASPAGIPGHYWQLSDTGPQTQTDPTSNVKTTYEDKTFYINRFNVSGNCWGIPTSQHIVLDYQPPPAQLSQVKRLGYNEVYFTNDDKDFIFQHAEYFWVSGPNAQETNKKFVDGGKILTRGTHFIRGRDIVTQTWGNSQSIDVVFRDDDELNNILTTSFDGTYAALSVSQSKAYFDQNGSGLQSQSKSQTTGYVLATESFKDDLDRVVGSTLPAPVSNSDFGYSGLFLLNNAGGKFSHADFSNPDPLDDTEFGTLGWYYSDNNNIEPLTPSSSLPFSRSTFYNDGTGEAKLSSGVGEALQIGSGHEVLSGTFPVHNELDDYLSYRSTAIPGITSVNTTLFHEAVQSITRDQNGRFVMSIVDKSGNTVMSGRRGSASDFALVVTNSVTASSTQNSQVYIYLFEDQSVTITGSGSMVVKNILTDDNFTPSGTWPAGFYRIHILSGTKTISYINRYLDVSYNYFDDRNRLIATISPNGFQQLKNSVPYSNIDHTTYQYNHQGWLLSMSETDAGTTNYAYRRDGSIRFSQNAEQAASGKYSYTNYDVSGRSIESGEYTPNSGLLFSEVRNNVAKLEAIGDSWMTGTPSATRSDWVKTHYDLPFADMELLLPGRRQDFLIGAVSWTENANIRTWYSYDELGRVQWMAQQPVQLPGHVFVTDYSYDFLGNVLTVSNHTYAAGTTNIENQFHHYYTYDADKRLKEVRTSSDGSSQTLQASYSYYLHGPLKRIELAGNLQGIDFVYNIQGWLKSINDPSSDPGFDGQAGEHSSFRKDVFGMALDYYENSMEIFQTGGIFNAIKPKKYHHLPGFEGDSGSLTPFENRPGFGKFDTLKGLNGAVEDE